MRYFSEEREDETEEDATDDDVDDDNDTITGLRSRSRVNFHRMAARTNSEILEDLAAIIRILRQINVLYHIFHRNQQADARSSFGLQLDDERTDLYNVGMMGEDEEEASKLLEAGLADLQAVLSTDQQEARIENKRQSTLALLALITYRHTYCSEQYLSRYLDPNGDYDPTLALFAAAIYDDNDESDCSPKSCRDIIAAAEELCGPDWLKEFDQSEDSILRNMLDKLALIAKVRLKVRTSEGS